MYYYLITIICIFLICRECCIVGCDQGAKHGAHVYDTKNPKAQIATAMIVPTCPCHNNPQGNINR